MRPLWSNFVTLFPSAHFRTFIGKRSTLIASWTGTIKRPYYGSIVPWVRRANGTLFATAGPDTLELHTPVPTRGEHMTSRADFEVGIGERVPFMLNYRPSYTPAQEPIDADETLASTEQNWLAWSQRCRYRGRWQAPVLRSLLTLKALIYGPPAESSPRRQPRCPSSPAACATGTTATAGCATRPSR